MQEKLFIQKGRFSFFFFQSKIVNCFYPKINDSSGLGQQGSQALGPGSSLSRAKWLIHFTDICQKLHSNGSHGTVGRTTEFWSNRVGPSFMKHWRVPPRYFSALWDKKLPTENSDIPFLSIKVFDTRSFMKHWRVPHEIFRHCERKNFQRKIMISPSYA